MAILSKTLALLALALSQTAKALPERRDAQVTSAPAIVPIRPCYTYTSTGPYTGPIYCPKFGPCPPHPECVVLEKKTITVPCSTKRCPITPTVTVTGPPSCPTCQTGCATETTYVTKTTGCITPY